MKYSKNSSAIVKIIKPAIIACLFLMAAVPVLADTIDGIVAVVDKNLIMRSDLNRRLLEIGINPNNELMSRKILELMIEEIIIEKTYSKYGLTPLNPEQVTQVAAENKVGYNTARIMMMRKTLMDMMVSQRVVVTPQMIRDYYDHNPEFAGSLSLDLKQIAIKDDKDKAEKAMKEIKAGRAFDDVAADYSDMLTDGKCDIGLVTLDQLDPAAAKLLEDAKEGDVVGPVQIKEYWCIFKVTGTKVTGAKDFDEVRDKISSSLEEKLREDAFEHWLKQIMGEYYIGIYM
jgi:parvulin-like peptidyl-prolyl isomerase